MESEKTAFLRGVLVRGIGSYYTAKDAGGNCYTLRCKKKFRRQGISPLTGDEVLFSPGEGEEHGWIEADLLLTDRIISRAVAQGMEILIAVNKTDLDSSLAPKLAEEYRTAEIPVFAVSGKRGEGLDALKDAMKGGLCCLTGQSGAGKSTLLNALLGLNLETGDISRKIARGKNTNSPTLDSYILIMMVNIN